MSIRRARPFQLAQHPADEVVTHCQGRRDGMGLFGHRPGKHAPQHALSLTTLFFDVVLPVSRSGRPTPGPFP